MPNYLFIQASPYDRAIGAEAGDLPPLVTPITQAPHISVAEDQGQSIIGAEAHIHTVAGGVVQVSDGDRLTIETAVAGPLGVAEAQINAVVVDSQIMTVQPEDPNRALAEALIAAGLATLDENGNLVAITDAASEQVATQEAPPPAIASDDAGIPITDNAINSSAPDEATQPVQGCETWSDVYYDPTSDQFVTAIYHSTGEGYEVFV